MVFAKTDISSQIHSSDQCWPPMAGVVAYLPGQNGDPARKARLLISFGVISSKDGRWGAMFRESDPPTGLSAIEWLLESDDPVLCVDDALFLLGRQRELVTALGCT
jgi:hypothetical protein